MDLQGLLSPDAHGFGARMKLIKARAVLGCRAKSRQRMEGNWEPKLGALVQAEEEGRGGGVGGCLACLFLSLGLPSLPLPEPGLLLVLSS